jgi:hypothetical protein
MVVLLGEGVGDVTFRRWDLEERILLIGSVTLNGILRS